MTIQVLDNFNDVQDVCAGKRVGWMIFEEKEKKRMLHQGYTNCLQRLKENNDLVVVDLIDFFMFLWALWKNHRVIRDYNLELPDYIKYFDGAADYLVFQDHHQQMHRLLDFGDIGKLKREVANKPYPYQYEANELVTKTFNFVYLMYRDFFKLGISESANMWKCGFRSYYYRDFLWNHLGAEMHIIEPPRDGDGLIPSDNPSHDKNEDRQALIEVNNRLRKYNKDQVRVEKKRIKEELKAKKVKKSGDKGSSDERVIGEVEEVHIFEDARYSDAIVVETMAQVNGRKNRIVDQKGSDLRKMKLKP